MRRALTLLALLGCLLALGLSACGGGDDEDDAGPLDTALGYVPADTPLALAVDTELDGPGYENVDAILKKFPLPYGSVREFLRAELASPGSGVNFDEDVEPILGNPAVLGASDVASFLAGSNDDDFVLVLQASDQEALDRLVEKTGAQETGEAGDATKYESGGTPFAVAGDVVVLAGSERLLDQAVERSGGDEHLDAERFGAALDGLPEDALARVYLNMRELLAADPDAAEARKVTWVDALRTLCMTATATGDGVEVEFNLVTDPEGLDEADLPMASGGDSPSVLDRDEQLNFGLRDPSQVVAFAEAAGQAIDPGGFGDYSQAKQTIESRLDVDIDRDLVGQLNGDMAASVGLDGSFGVRAELRDPEAVAATLKKAAPVLGDLAEGAGTGAVQLQEPSGDDGLYALAQSDGDAVWFGVVNDVLVVANEEASARELASAEPQAVEGAEGALAMSADGQELANAVLGGLEGLDGLEAFGAQLVTAPLEQLRGSAVIDTDGLRGRVTLAID